MTTLLERLRDEFPDSSGRSLRTWLVAGRVRVGGEIVRDPRTLVAPGDAVTLGPAPPPALAAPLRLIHEDDSILVIEKPPGLLSIGTEHERERTAYRMVWAYLKGARPPRRPFIVHRLDRETSGLLVVAKTPEAQARLQGQFAAGNAERRYAAIVEGVVTKDEGMLRDVLIEERSLRVRPADPGRPAPKGRRARIAITWYRVIERRADVDAPRDQARHGPATPDPRPDGEDRPSRRRRRAARRAPGPTPASLSSRHAARLPPSRHRGARRVRERAAGRVHERRAAGGAPRDARPAGAGSGCARAALGPRLDGGARRAIHLGGAGSRRARAAAAPRPPGPVVWALRSPSPRSTARPARGRPHAIHPAAVGSRRARAAPGPRPPGSVLGAPRSPPPQVDRPAGPRTAPRHPSRRGGIAPRASRGRTAAARIGSRRAPICPAAVDHPAGPRTAPRHPSNRRGIAPRASRARTAAARAGRRASVLISPAAVDRPAGPRTAPRRPSRRGGIVPRASRGRTVRAGAGRRRAPICPARVDRPAGRRAGPRVDPP